MVLFSVLMLPVEIGASRSASTMLKDTPTTNAHEEQAVKRALTARR